MKINCPQNAEQSVPPPDPFAFRPQTRRECANEFLVPVGLITLSNYEAGRKARPAMVLVFRQTFAYLSNHFLHFGQVPLNRTLKNWLPLRRPSPLLLFDLRCALNYSISPQVLQHILTTCLLRPERPRKVSVCVCVYGNAYTRNNTLDATNLFHFHSI